jgi:hypothetical protein
MNARRSRRILFALVGLCLLASLALLVGVASGFWRSSEPTYQGKSVSVWFEEYARLSSRQGAPVAIIQGPSGRTLMVAGTVEPLPDPAWEALKAIGSNAVPYLIRRLRVSPLESPLYTRVFTNLPPVIRSRLPSPWKRRWDRQLAAEALGGLGEQAIAAAPALLKALKQADPDPLTRNAILNALRRIHVDQRSLNVAMLELGATRRYADVIAIAQQSGWKGDDMARLLGEILRTPDPAVRRDAMRLLEYAGTEAAPALDNIILALKDSDKEVRYFAARSIEAIGTNSPQVVAALRAALKDENVMVQIVARRTLTNCAPNAILPP